MLKFFMLASLLLVTGKPQQPQWPVPVDETGHVIYKQEYAVQGHGPRRILDAVKAWLFIHAQAVEGTFNDDHMHDVFSGKFFLTAQGVSTLPGKISKGDFTYTLEVQEFEGRYILKLHNIRTTDPLKPQTLKERYMLDYETWKQANTFGLLSDEKLGARFKKYQEESLAALTHIDVTLKKLQADISAYVAN